MASLAAMVAEVITHQHRQLMCFYCLVQATQYTVTPPTHKHTNRKSVYMLPIWNDMLIQTTETIISGCCRPFRKSPFISEETSDSEQLVLSVFRPSVGAFCTKCQKLPQKLYWIHFETRGPGGGLVVRRKQGGLTELLENSVTTKEA